MHEDLLRYRFIAENTLDLICETTLEGYYTYLSPSYKSVLGYEPEELVGQHFGTLVHAGDREIVLRAFSQHTADLKPGQATFRYRHQDGSWRWLETLGKPIRYAGSDGRAVFVSRDITEWRMAEERLRRMEKRLKMVVDHIPVIICATDCEGDVTLCEGKGLEGLERNGAETVGLPIAELCKNLPDTIELFRKALAGETLSATVEADGRIFEAYVTPAPDEGGALPGMAGVFLDVTEGRMVEKALEEERLKRSKLESLAVLAGGIAHDFNNLLTSVLGNISLAQMEADPTSEIAGNLAEAEEACLRTRDMVAELSTFARGGGPVKKPVRLEECIRAAVQQTGRQNDDIICEVDTEPGLWTVPADERQIGQVLQNLIKNARQAMSGGGVITIQARNSKETGALPEGPYVMVSVSDHGTGIRQAHLGRIFEPYFTTRSGRHGLGLATAYSIVANHGGALLAESQEGAGSTFRMYLPVAQAELEELQQPSAQKPSWRGGPARILVMDDEESIRGLMLRMLTGKGFEVEAADDGGAAVRLYQAALDAGRPFDVVLLDLRVPMGMGGMEAFRAMREINPGVKAIVSSGYSEHSIMSNYREYGLAAVVPKPYHAHELLGTLHRLLGS